MKYDKNPSRHCTMPKILGLRDWFENRFGDLCEAHDKAYVYRTCKMCADWRLVKGMFQRGYWWLAPIVWIIFATVGWFFYLSGKKGK